MDKILSILDNKEYLCVIKLIIKSIANNIII